MNVMITLNADRESRLLMLITNDAVKSTSKIDGECCDRKL